MRTGQPLSTKTRRVLLQLLLAGHVAKTPELLSGLDLIKLRLTRLLALGFLSPLQQDGAPVGLPPFLPPPVSVLLPQ